MSKKKKSAEPCTCYLVSSYCKWKFTKHACSPAAGLLIEPSVKGCKAWWWWWWCSNISSARGPRGAVIQSVQVMKPERLWFSLGQGASAPTWETTVADGPLSNMLCHFKSHWGVIPCRAAWVIGLRSASIMPLFMTSPLQCLLPLFCEEAGWARNWGLRTCLLIWRSSAAASLRYEKWPHAFSIHPYVFTVSMYAAYWAHIWGIYGHGHILNSPFFPPILPHTHIKLSSSARLSM